MSTRRSRVTDSFCQNFKVLSLEYSVASGSSGFVGYEEDVKSKRRLH
jgi:hypothetical protein